MDWVRQEEGLAYGLGAPKGGLLKGTIAPIPLCPGGSVMPKPPPSPVLYGVGTL